MRGECPACGGGRLRLFHSVDAVPVNSCLLVRDQEAALAFPRGELRLGHCPDCGFITNTAFDPRRSTYSADYEETQAFSAHFREFIAELAADWVARFDLRGRRVVEIGCGKGEFLTEMVRAGVGTTVGVDPGVHLERIPDDVRERMAWVHGFFPRDLPVLDADAVVCRHTLEHIGPVGEFARAIRGAVGDRPDTVVLFEVPGTLHVLRDVWFWDTYYEHCSYFTAGSLARLFRRSGFEVTGLRHVYDDQYVVVEARPATGPAHGDPLLLEDDLDEIASGVERFATGYRTVVERWRGRVREVAAAGGRTVIWGGGSKGVAFLTALGDDAALVEAAVDINPFKHGLWMAGTGHRVIAPKQLVDLAPELVVVMNSVYVDEIWRDLAELGLAPAVEAL